MPKSDAPAIRHVVIHTDGSCLGNPGPGGYGAVLDYKGRFRELSGGFRSTTNNRMELMAVIAGLEALKEPCRVSLFSDSKYVVEGVTKGWAKRWKSRGWMRNKQERAENADLWNRLLNVLNRHEVDFRWVRGHAGNAGNERADKLALAAANGKNLPRDEGYENPRKGLL